MGRGERVEVNLWFIAGWRWAGTRERATARDEKPVLEYQHKPLNWLKFSLVASPCRRRAVAQVLLIFSREEVARHSSVFAGGVGCSLGFRGETVLVEIPSKNSMMRNL